MRTHVRRALGGLLGALLAATTIGAAPPASAASASISGTLRADDTGAVIEGCVSAHRASDAVVMGFTCTGDENAGGLPGHWRIDDLVAGVDYKLYVKSAQLGYLPEWAQDASSFAAAQAYTAPTSVNIGLTRAAGFTGRLQDAYGRDAADAQVTLYPTNGSASTSTTTDLDGTWAVTVKAGDYRVRFRTSDRTQWAYGQRTSSTARVFRVATGGSLTVNDRITPAAWVKGTIRRDSDGKVIPYACARVVTTRDHTVAERCADGAGVYRVPVPRVGTYKLRFHDKAGSYAFEYWNNASTVSSGTAFTLGLGSVKWANASLAKGARFTGVAVDHRTGAPVPGACASIWRGRTGGQVYAVVTCSGADGRWQVRGLPGGTYVVGLGAFGYLRTYLWNRTTRSSADPVYLAKGTTKSVGTVRLRQTGTLSGVVTDKAGQPVAGAWVDATGALRPGATLHSAQTDAAGRFTITNLTPGSYKPSVFAADEQAFAPEWSGDADSLATATAISVTGGATATFSPQVAPGARIEGVIVRHDGSPVTGGFHGQVVEAATGRWIGHVWSVEHGRFTTSALPSGAFKLQVVDDMDIEYAWYDGVLAMADAKVVTLAREEHETITFHLAPQP